jgi:hypothetical protein
MRANSCNKVKLSDDLIKLKKGQSHEIFDLWFFFFIKLYPWAP